MLIPVAGAGIRSWFNSNASFCIIFKLTIIGQRNLAHCAFDCALDFAIIYRGRDGHRWPPPAQIRTRPTKASGSYLGCLTSNRMSGQG